MYIVYVYSVKSSMWTLLAERGDVRSSVSIELLSLVAAAVSCSTLVRSRFIFRKRSNQLEAYGSCP